MNHELFSFYLNFFFFLIVFINCELFIKFLEYLNAWPPVKQFLFNCGATMPKKLKMK